MAPGDLFPNMPELQSGTAPSRVIIENVKPRVDEGRFPAKRVLGETVHVKADIFCDGHDLISAVVLYRRNSESGWSEQAMEALPNDLWQAEFQIDHLEDYSFTVIAWVDQFKTWRRDFKKRVDAGQDVAVDLLMGVELIEDASSRASGEDQAELQEWADYLKSQVPIARRVRRVFDDRLFAIADAYSDRSRAARYDQELRIAVDRVKARFSSWYEMFPRSCSSDGESHGTFRDCEQCLEYVSSMGFDVLYMPPVHPIGVTKRKGKNNTTSAQPGDPGSPWAIGAAEGGHTGINPALGTLQDFLSLRQKAEEHGIELAMDIAFQTTPDHPYVKEHPSWFRHRPDGSIQYAENPPKRYEDIYPFDFENEDWRALWTELRDVLLFWLEKGIRIFRVDNPHTKPFAFWEWVIGEVRAKYPETIFLSEAFTRPKVMYRLAKIGFTQSYTYFTWRNTKQELTDYLTELTRTDVHEFFRPNFWPNTPDILPEPLHHAGRSAFASRLVLAATLDSNYGIYGPAYELLDNTPVAPGKEEYLNSEKYEMKSWDRDRPDSLKDLIARVNRIRRENPALQTNRTLQFHEIDNPQLIAYSKTSEDGSNIIVTVVNLDPYQKQSGWLKLDLNTLKIDPRQPFQAHDLLGGARFLWNGSRNQITIDPQAAPAHIFGIRRRLRTERDFDYYM